MGCCINSKHGPRARLPASNKLQYSLTTQLTIQTVIQDFHTTKQVKVRLELPNAIKVEQQVITLSDVSAKISQCILPGIDPRGQSDKPCQDNCFVSYDSDTFLVGLYDGHGRFGRDVVLFCEDFVTDFFTKNQEMYNNEPTLFILEATNNVHQHLQISNIDVMTSGTTQVMLMYYKGLFYIGSLGDSRAILGTSSPPDVHPAIEPKEAAEKRLLTKIRNQREIPSTHMLTAVQLTKDQKPDDPDEFSRIVKSGGRVQRLTDLSGKPVGPFRVWRKTENTPGLAMSRSIGDIVGSEIGVIHNPIITSQFFIPNNDQFIVIASDGVWDVMNNDEVINYVDLYRHHAQGQIGEDGDMITPLNTNIARLLCEEARVRWLSVVEQEDVPIDDISAVVIELSPIALPLSQDLGVGMRSSAFLQRDPLRSSIMDEKMEIEEQNAGILDKL